VKERARFCLACGARLRAVSEHGRRRRRCPRCGWTFYDNPVFASVAIIRRRGRMLLAKRAYPPYAGTWDLPGGFIEAGETPEAGMRRELREELGVGTRRLRLLGFATDRYGPAGFPVLTAIYRVTLAPGPIGSADDVSEVRWFPESKLPFRTIAFPSLRRALKLFLKTYAGRSKRVRC
jgi:ADP-ribose pyrophosphatase YjhB (NUDIX family)